MSLYNFEPRVLRKASSYCVFTKYTSLWKVTSFLVYLQVFVIIFTGIQITVPTKNQETQCTLLKEFFVTSKPSQSKDEESASEEEMDADDDPSYVPDPDDEMGEDKDFDDFDDCLYE